MKKCKNIIVKSACVFLLFSVICGLFYPALITGIAQAFFPNQANGSIIEVNGKTYGSALLAQEFTDPSHMWGRIMHVDVKTYKDANGQPLMYATPSNLSPTSKAFKKQVEQRIKMLKEADPSMKEKAIPVDLVTGSGSGLDPDISPAAAYYQVDRIAQANHKTKAEIRSMIKKCTEKPFLGLFGQETVNVLKVNLMIDGILK